MDAATITQPMAVTDDSTVAALPRADAPGAQPRFGEMIGATVAKVPPVQIVMMVLGTIAFLYFARPVVLPIFLPDVCAPFPCHQKSVHFSIGGYPPLAKPDTSGKVPPVTRRTTQLQKASCTVKTEDSR
jgi:hypothetical protein